MRNLFAFLWKFQFFALFIILQVISIILLANSYSYHQSKIFGLTSELSGDLFSSLNNVTGYLNLKKENQRLVTENARLRNQLKSSFLITDTCTAYIDSLYHVIPAKVISATVSRPNNYIMINKGRRHGIKKEMAVISSDGMAGFVVAVSEHYSFIMSTLHSNTRVSATIVKNGQLVNITWPGYDYRSGAVIDIPSHVHLIEGDTLVTSGNSLIFPQGIMIGTIIEQKESLNKGLGEASIRFSTDFNSLQYVYVIKNQMKNEQENLIKEAVKNE